MNVQMRSDWIGLLVLLGALLFREAAAEEAREGVKGT